MSLSTAAAVVGAFQIGGTVGALVLGYFMDQGKPESVLIRAYLVGAAFITLLGIVISSPIGLAVCIFLAGACVSGSMTWCERLGQRDLPH